MATGRHSIKDDAVRRLHEAANTGNADHLRTVVNEILELAIEDAFYTGAGYHDGDRIKSKDYVRFAQWKLSLGGYQDVSDIITQEYYACKAVAEKQKAPA